MNKWYVINVFSSKENKMKELIEKEIEINNLNKFVDQVLVPKEKYYQVRKGKKIKSERNFYPGYVMINCDINGEITKCLKSINGVIGFLTNANNYPLPMSDREVTNMLKRIDDMTVADDTLIDSLFKIGQTVEVIEGPFTSFSGSVSKINNERKTVTVDIRIFGRSTPVIVPYDQVTS